MSWFKKGNKWRSGCFYKRSSGKLRPKSAIQHLPYRITSLYTSYPTWGHFSLDAKEPLVTFSIRFY